MKKLYKMHENIFLIIGFISLLSSCNSPNSTNLLQQKEPIYPAKEIEEYKIQVNDEISCIILTSDTELSESFNGVLTSSAAGSGYSAGGNSYVVFENGNIHIPYLGEINIVNLTIAQAEDRIQRKMRESFPDALVRVRLINNVFYIVSAGKNGTFNVFKENMTIYQALSISGNVDAKIDLSKIKIVRNENGRDIIKTFNLKTESVIESEFYYIKPNDVIYYSTSKGSFFRVDSFGSLIGTIIAPITFVLGMIALKTW